MTQATTRGCVPIYRLPVRVLVGTFLMSGTLGTALIGSSTVASAAPVPVCTAVACTVTFPTPGMGQNWTVPSGVASESVTLYGAAGGEGFDAIGGGIGAAGGDGATVRGTLSLSAGTTIVVDVGGRGGSADFESKAGGINGGGSSLDSGGGGGATDVEVGGDGLSDRVLVAGGGGGAGADSAAYGPDGLDHGSCQTPTGGLGGAADQNGDPGEPMDIGSTPDFTLGAGGGGLAGNSPGEQGEGGVAGTPSAPVVTDCLGNAGVGPTAGSAGVNGSFGQGGSGGAGGGGGGGEIGGGSGGGGSSIVTDSARDYSPEGGGGGGSSYGGGVSDYQLLNDAADVGADPSVSNDGGDGEAVITYTFSANTTPVVGNGQIAGDTPSTPSTLAFTGLNLTPLLLLGSGLVASGAMLSVLARRRRRST
jgi:hypothetical protein